MKKHNLLFVLFFALFFKINAQSCSVKECIKLTFESQHTNWWKITNSIDGRILNDSFSYIESKIGDTLFNNFNGNVSVFMTTKHTLITEFEDRSIYYIKKETPVGKQKYSSSNLDIDSLAKYFAFEEDNILDSISENTYQGSINGFVIRIKIKPDLCLVESIEMTSEEIEDGTDKNGFYATHKVLRTITYVLLENENSPQLIRHFISENTLVDIQQNSTKIKSAYKSYGFTLENLNEQ